MNKKKKIKRVKVPGHAWFSRSVKMVRVKDGYKFITLKEK